MLDKKNVITIRVNGEKKVFYREEDVQSEDEVAAAEEREEERESDFPWVLAEKESSGSENKQSNKILDFQKRKKEKNLLSLPFWDDGKRDKGPKLPPAKRKKRRPNRHNFSWPQLPGKMLAIVLSAIIVGSGFGLMLLTVFTSSTTDQASSAAGLPEEATVDATQEGTQQAASVTDDEFTGGIPGLTVHVVQGGAYSTQEKGKEAIQQLRSDGYPAVLTEETDPMYLFIGVAPSQSNSNQLAEMYTESGYDTYTKVHIVTSESSVAEATAEYLYSGTQLVDELVQLGVVLTLQGNEVSDEQLVALAEQWYAWRDQLEDLSESESVVTAANEWTAKTGEAVEGLQHDSVSGWDVQHHVLESVLLYENLVSQLNES